MRNIKMHIQYDGSKYKGWQILKDNNNTIQGKIEQILSLMTGEDIHVISSGRTDAGVHAKMQVINFHTNFEGSIDYILDYCLKYMPKDILVYEAFNVDEDFHSRYHVKEKEYTYYICNKKFYDLFSRKYTYNLPEKLDIDAIKEASTYLIGEHDFKAFTALKSKKKSTVRNIYSIDITNSEGNISIVYKGNGFLYKMVRILTGTLIEVGLHNLSPLDIEKALKSKDRFKVGSAAPAHGLFMTNVKY
ncbi:tRNA pseudouridine(38-40) synthase TruA [Clostridium niameyense]|uniref:tRNA pseudouridine synthase A n=1 Tax=Clostridium niameyense TaxID=1622073 RepID=A0A6M0R7Z0_9CLOT|nr:tRNA pseudouridine(38-40) synthase TruA [Clostridium niameyense]NEZ46335.1 tRNA pseudouridine(38-40) synthase TruA [Clostridium niameyense]